MNPRLPQLPVSTAHGLVYVVQQGTAYKIGFTRRGLSRRVRDSGGRLVMTMPAGQRPAQLEYAINRRFAAKRLDNYRDNDGGKREWFALNSDDIKWLRGLAAYLKSQR